jgi:hypothetical protein
MVDVAIVAALSLYLGLSFIRESAITIPGLWSTANLHGTCWSVPLIRFLPLSMAGLLRPPFGNG